MIIAIDGTSGSGKSTLAKTLAKKLNFGFFSAGALYRAITVKALNLHIKPEEDDKLEYMIEHTDIIYTYDGTTSVMLLDGIDVAEKLHIFVNLFANFNVTHKTTMKTLLWKAETLAQ